jgi:isoleucyl-tRNA synthetase
LRRALVLLPDHGAFSEAVAVEVADALNVKHLEAVTDLEGLLEYGVVPNFRTLGPKVGKQVPQVKEALAAADGGAVKRALDDDGGYDLVLADGSTVRLAPDDVEVRADSHAELALAQEGGYAVAIDTKLDDELRAEGTARDAIRLVNELRKSAGLEISDRVRLRLHADGRVEAALHVHRDWIAREVLAVELVVSPLGEATPVATRVDVDGEELAVVL